MIRVWLYVLRYHASTDRPKAAGCGSDGFSPQLYAVYATIRESGNVDATGVSPYINLHNLWAGNICVAFFKTARIMKVGLA